ncbi:hypothetical protein DT076_15600 [Desertihabitans brevis]|uniref:Uncharacterized protein n=1 Tax=Desertihabitans brevis TaxID=2268447 RepID=A0A367YRX5_9ACTN|nr:hypothetical protein DT076_15600 [Desertihabitans brevis]
MHAALSEVELGQQNATPGLVTGRCRRGRDGDGKLRETRMVTSFADLLDPLREWRRPRMEEPLTLECRLSAPVADAAGWVPSAPEELRDLRGVGSESWLFYDLDYGQWGMYLSI